MRKALIAVIVASALFAVGAFAASFAFTAEDVASGQDDVLSCADTVEVTFPDAEWIAETESYRVANAKFSFFDGTAPALDCSGIIADLRLQLDDPDTEADDVDETDSLAIGSDGTVTLPGPFEVEDIVGAAALIENISIDANGVATTFP